VDLTRTLLEWLIANGPATLALVAFICALGVPLPIPVLIIGAGALVRQGQMNLATAVAVTLTGALLAELVWYAAGRELGPRARSRMGRRFASVYDEAERRFRQHPGLTVYLTRWLLQPIGIPTSLIAGASAFPVRRFIPAAVAGNLMWVVAYTAIGYALGSEWQNVSPVLDRYKLWIGGAAVVIGLGIITYRNRYALAHAGRVALAWLTPHRPVVKPVEVEATEPTDRVR
jgi:membrane protein DedA with SNARE-associated domain